MAAPSGEPTPITLNKLAMTLVDLAGYTRMVQDRSAVEVARFLDDYYRLCHRVTVEHGGRIVKYLGDAALAVFPPDRCPAAVDSVRTIQEAVPALGARHGLPRLESGANVHVAPVAEAELGPEEDRRYDVIGQGVNHLFLMGGGPGCRISEPVYRQLPSDLRSGWDKKKPPATYHLTE